MAKQIANYSKTQDVLKPDDWESLRVINERSKTARLVAEKLRGVVTRLLSASDGQYDIDDFAFLVTDEADPNAFYISSKNTENKKHVVAVSSAMIDFCENESELAGVVAHELGHFTYDNLLGGNRNTVFQERGSDLHAVDLLMDGGYDPKAYERLSAKLFLKSRGNVLSALGVHGDAFARVEDIRTYLTYLKKEHGDFKPSADNPDDYKKFKAEFDGLFPNDRYLSWLDQLFIQKFGTNDILSPDIGAVLALLITEMPGEALSAHPPRLNDLEQKLKAYHYAHQKELPTADVRKKLQALAEIVVGQIRDKNAVHPKLKLEILDRLHWLNDEAFEPFGELKTIADDIQKFIDAKTIEQASAIATKHDLYKILDFGQTFRFPRFEMPAEADAIGKEIPYARHEKWAKQDMAIEKFLINLVGLPRSPDNLKNALTKPKWPDGNYYDTFEENGVIILTGDAAKKYKAELSASEAERERLKKSKENHEYFMDQLETLNRLADYANGKMTATEFWDVEKEKNNKNNTVPYVNEAINKITNNYYQTIDNNPFEASDLAAAMDSRAYKTFAKMPASLRDAIANAKKNSEYYDKGKSTDSRVLDGLFNLNANPAFIRNICDALMRLSVELPSGREQLLVSLYKELPFTISGRIYESGGVDGDDKENLIKEVEQARDESRDKIRDFYTNNAHPISWLHTFNAGDMMLKSITNTAFRAGEPTPALDHIFEKMGVSDVRDADDFHKKMSILVYTPQMENMRFAIGYFIAKYLRADGDIGDLMKFFDKNPDGPRIKNEPFEQDELAKYIARHNLIPTNDFATAFKIFQEMEFNNWFSANESNEPVILDILVKNIRAMPRDERMKNAFAMLAGNYEESKYNRKDTLFNFPDQKNQLMEIFADAVLERYGRDDGSAEYDDAFQDILDFINGDVQTSFRLKYRSNIKSPFYQARLNKPREHYKTEPGWGEPRHNFNATDKAKLLRMLSDKIVSQEKLSDQMRDNRLVAVADIDAQMNDYKARAFEGVLAFLEKEPARAEATIRFINARLTPESIEKFRTEIITDQVNEETQRKYLTRQALEIMHQTFWSEDIGMRAVVMNKLLNRYSDDVAKQIEYVCNMHFPKNDKYRKDAEIIFRATIMALEPFERSLILAAVASADENKDDAHKNASKSVGAGLRMLFENMGPAWLKTGQLLSYVPELPSEIREELGKLKDKADMPARWDLFDEIKATLPDELQKNIVSVDEVLGAGSFWVTTKIKYVNVKTGAVETKVLSLLRPYALERSRAGFNTIEAAVKDMAKQNSKFKSLAKVVRQAKASSEYEVDVVYGNGQFEKAKAMYAGMSVVIDGDRFTPDVADWEYYGAGRDRVGYKLMEMANGKSLSRAGDNVAEKKKMALAYVTVELVNLFKGDVWDIDRHMGQQNFEHAGPGIYNINIFDTGAQTNKVPGRTDKMLLAEVLYGLIRATRIGTPMDQQILKTIKNMDRLENYLKVDTSYVADVQKGLMALSDIIEYQKEIKDKDGNIIQPRLALSADDLEAAMMAAFNNPTIDKTIKVSLAGKVLLNKLRPLRRGWASSLNEGITKKENPIKIEFAPHFVNTHSVEFDKPADEIARLESDAASEKILGINRKYIKRKEEKSPLDPTMFAEQKQIG